MQIAGRMCPRALAGVGLARWAARPASGVWWCERSAPRADAESRVLLRSCFALRLRDRLRYTAPLKYTGIRLVTPTGGLSLQYSVRYSVADR